MNHWIKWISFLGIYLLTNYRTNLFSQAEFLIEIDPVTANYKKIGPAIPLINWVNPQVRGYDTKNSRYFVKGGELNQVDHLYTLNVKNGNVLHRVYAPPSGNTIHEFKYDNLTDQLIGLVYDSGMNQFKIAKVNPSDGTYTLANFPISFLSGLNQGGSTYDENNKRLFVHSSNEVFVINANNGVLINKVDFKINFPATQLLNFEYNNKTNKLVGLYIESGNTYFCEINFNTGDVLKIGNGLGFGVGGGNGTINYEKDQYISVNLESGGYYIGIVDINSGALLSHSKIPLDPGDNIQSVEYDNNLKKLFGIHWDAQISVPKVIADFSADKVSGCAPLTVKFTNQSVNAEAIRWNFPGGNPDISYESNPTVIYTKKGQYDVILSAANSTNSAEKNLKNFITVDSQLQKNNITYKISALKVQFGLQLAEGTNHSWDFGDNTTASNEQNPLHEYKAEGDYPVILKYITGCGELTIQKTIAVLLIPRVEFTTVNNIICAGDFIEFKDQSSNDVIEWDWQFEGGTPSGSKEQFPKIKFSKPGKYSVKLSVKNSNGENSITKLSYIIVKSAIKCPKIPKKKIKLEAESTSETE